VERHCNCRLILLFFALFFSIAAAASPQVTTYQARIVKPDGLPLETANVNFKFSVLNPAADCILYAETFSAINMANSAGIISFTLGSGVKTYPASATTFAQVFSNSTPALSCENGTPPSFSPLSTDVRKVVMQFNDGAGWQTLPAMSINAVPYAIYAGDSQLLGGVSATNFVQYSTIPTCTASEALRYNGSSFNCIDVASGGGVSATVTSADITSALGYTPANPATLAASYTAQADFATVSGSVTTLVSAMNAMVTSVGAITSSQWVTSGSTINYSAGNVGVGITTPITKLDVSGGVRIGMEAASCATAFAGTLRYTAGNVEYCNGFVWSAFGVAGSGLVNFNGSTSSTQTLAAGSGGTAPSFSTVNGVHTINIPNAASAAVTAGLLANADYQIFTNKMNATSAAVISALGYTPASVTAYAMTTYQVRVATNANITLSGNQTIDGVSVVAGDRVLVKNQSAQFENGVYVANAGAWVRATDMNSWEKTIGYKAQVTEGTAWAGMTFTSNTSVGGALNSTPLEWSSAGSTGSLNTAHGLNALGANTTGSDNAAYGPGALSLNTIGSVNTANGLNALRSNSTGSYNTAYGAISLFSNTSGSYNTATGYRTLYFNTGNYNTATGYRALYLNSLGNNNTATGYNALTNSTGDNNTAIGYSAGSAITTGSNNVVIGSNTGLSFATDSNNISISDGSGNERIRVVSSGNVGIGTTTPSAALEVSGGIKLSGTSATLDIPVTSANAGYMTMSGELLLHASGDYNVYLGKSAGNLIGTGTQNTGVGHHALKDVTLGYENVALGDFTMAKITTGGENTALGSEAMSFSVSGNANVAVGIQALMRNSNNENTIVGAYGLNRAGDGSKNTGMGYAVMNKLTAASNNVGAGWMSLRNLTTGNSNIAIGYNAGSDITTGSGNVVIGGNTGVSFATESNNISINDGLGNERIRIVSSGNVGIGTSTPVTKLEVSGGLRISMEAATCAINYAGTLRYNSGLVEYCNGSSWSAFGVAGTGITLLNGSASGTQTFVTGVSGNNFNITSNNGVHAFNIPLAASGSVTAGLLSNADYTTFSNKVSATSSSVISALGYTPASVTTVAANQANINSVSSAVNSLSVSTAASFSAITSSQWVTNGTTINYMTGAVGIGTTTPGQALEVSGTIKAAANIFAGDGTVTAPSIAFGNNTQTGFYRPGANVIGLAIAGSEKLRVNSSGNVGIGTNSPAARLDVAGGGGSVFQVVASSNTTATPDVDSDFLVRLMPQTTGGEGGHLEFKGSGSYQDWTIDSTAGELRFFEPNQSRTSTKTRGGFNFMVNPSTTSASTQFTALMITNSGNVGIGTTTPNTSALLEVSSTTKGFLPPRMTTIQRNAISSPATGLTIYNTDNVQIEFYSGSVWMAMGGVPNGTIAAFAAATCPTGWTEYAPAYGRFLRGIDKSGTSIDPSGLRAPGNIQTQATAKNGLGLTDPGHSHSVTGDATGTDNVVGVDAGAASTGGNYSGIINGSATGITLGSSDAETRPVNVAVLYCQYVGGTPGITLPNISVIGGVNISSPINGDGLVFNSTSGNWENIAVVRKSGDTMTGTLNLPSNGLTVGTNQLVVSGSNVGIGTTAPTTTLHVQNASTNTNAAATLESTGAGGRPYLKFRAEGTDMGYVGYGSTAQPNLILMNYVSGPTYLGTNSLIRMTITSAGAIGIGTQTPENLLDVAGTAQVNYLKVDASDGVSEGGEIQLMGSGAYGNIQLDNFQGNFRVHTLAAGKKMQVLGGTMSVEGTGGTNYFAAAVGIGNPSPAVALDVTGDIRGTGVVATWSDARTKKNIKVIPDSLNKILHLRGVGFDWRTDEFPDKKFKTTPDIGVIAQEVEKVFPEVVKTSSDGYKSVGYAQLVAPLIEAVKELYYKITGVERKVDRTVAEVDALKAENAELKSRLDRLEKMMLNQQKSK